MVIPGTILKQNRRAVGSIIGGVFILLILLMGYTFYTVSNKAINTQQLVLSDMRAYDLDRSQEAFKSDKEPLWSLDHLEASIQNIGPKPVNIINIGVWDSVSWKYDATIMVWEGDEETGIWRQFDSPEPITSGGYKKFYANIPGIIEKPPKDWTYKLQFITDKGTVFEVGYPDASKNPTNIVNIINQGISKVVGEFIPFQFSTAIQWTTVNSDNTINPNNWNYGHIIPGNTRLAFKADLVYYGNKTLYFNEWSSIWFTSTEGKTMPPGHGTTMACYIVSLNGNRLITYSGTDPVVPSEEGTRITLYFGDWDVPGGTNPTTGPEISDLPATTFTSLAIYGNPANPSDPPYGQTYSLMATIFANPGPLNRFAITGYPSSINAEQNFGSNAVTVTAYDTNGLVKTNYTGQIYFTSTDPNAVLPYTSGSTYRFTTGNGRDNGVHTFVGTGFTLKTVGSQTITVTDGTVFKASNSINVNPANQAPVIDTYLPASNPTVTEGGSQGFSVTFHDPDGATPTGRWLLDTIQVGTGNSYMYSPDYSAAGQHIVKVEVSDGFLIAEHTWTVTVTNIVLSDYIDASSDNHPPIDIGIHSNFNAQKAGPDSTFDSLTETMVIGSPAWTKPLTITAKCGESKTKGPDGTLGNEDRLAIYTIDNNIATFWQHNVNHNHEIVFDMGQINTISSVRIYQDNTQAYRWGNGGTVTIYVSNNPTGPWTTPVSTGWNAAVGGGWQTSPTFSATGRYIRLYATANSNTNNAVMYEFDAMCSSTIFQLDLEEQFTSITNWASYSKLRINAGTLGAENIEVYYWNGASWSLLLSDLNTGLNEVSVTLTGPTYELRFKAATDTGDATQDTWQIDSVWLYAP